MIEVYIKYRKNALDTPMYFFRTKAGVIGHSGIECENPPCRALLSIEYIRIIKQLIKAKLLPENYRLLCCMCKDFFVKRRRGLL